MKILPIEGVIGLDTTAAQVRGELKGAGDVELQVNSPGGFVHDGIAIHNLLRDHRRAGHRVTARIMGLAASASSFIPLAAETITVMDNAIVFVHNPHMMAVGDQHAMTKAARLLDSAAALLGEAYARRLGVDAAAARALMDAETWWHGPEALAAGFADSVESSGDSDTDRAQALATAQLAVNGALDSIRTHPEPLDRLAALLPTDRRQPEARRPEPAQGSEEAERERILGILTLPEARDRQAAALELAKLPTMTMEAARAVLASLPAAASARQGPTAFERHMAALGNPILGDDHDADDHASFDPAAWEILRPAR